MAPVALDDGVLGDGPLGILCAIPQELGHLVGALDGATHQAVGRYAFHTGRLEGRRVVLAEAGIGKVNTAAVATLLAERFQASLLLFSGVAGGLDPDLAIGDVVLADRTLQHDAGWIEAGELRPYQAGHVPFFNPTQESGWQVPQALLARARALLEGVLLPPLSAGAGGHGAAPRLVVGTIVSGDQYIHCEATRARLFAEHGGAAVEMEGGALAQVAAAFGVPWLNVRALSDLAGADSRHDFARFAEEVGATAALLVRRLAAGL